MYILPVAYIISFFIGYYFARLIWDGSQPYHYKSDGYMHLILSMPLGMGISSLISFYCLLLFNKADRGVFLFAHLLVLLALLILSSRRKRRSFSKEVIAPHSIKGIWLAGLILILLFAFLRMLPFFIKYPQGNWDASTCWNLKARFIFLSDNWLRAFSPLMTAENYPPLLPINIAWGWLLSGTDSPLGPILVAMIYTFSIILFSFQSVERYYGPKKALLILLFLVTIPEFLIVAIYQYADIVLSCYNSTGAICCFIAAREKRRDYMLLGQILLGLSAFTKREGLLFFIAINLVMLFYFAFRHKSLLKLLFQGWALAALPLVTLSLFGRIVYTPRREFIVGSMTAVLFFAKTIIFFLFTFDNIFLSSLWSLFWFIFLVSFAFLYKIILKNMRLIIALASFLLFLGYFIVFILKSEAPWNTLSFTYHRFIPHILPVLCFLIADVLFEEEDNQNFSKRAAIV